MKKALFTLACLALAGGVLGTSASASPSVNVEVTPTIARADETSSSDPGTSEPTNPVVNFVPSFGSYNDTAWGFSYVGMSADPAFPDFGIWTDQNAIVGDNDTYVIHPDGSIEYIDSWTSHGTYLRIYQGLMDRHGDVIVVPEGWGFINSEYTPTTTFQVEQEYKFVCTLDNGAFGEWEVFQAPTGITIEGGDLEIGTTDPARTLTANIEGETNGYLYWRSANTSVARIDSNGLLTPVGAGTTTVTAFVGDVEATINVTVEEGRDPSTITSATFENIPNYFSVTKDSDPSTFAPDLTDVVFNYEDGSQSGIVEIPAEDITISEFSTAEAGRIDVEVTVAYEGYDITGTIAVDVYEVQTYDRAPGSVSIIDWWQYGMFIDCSNVSLNDVNISKGEACLDEIASYITYKRGDEEIGITVNQLQYRICILPDFLKDENGSFIGTADNYLELYQVGDILTLEAGTPTYFWTGESDPGDQMIAGTGEIRLEGRFAESHSYRFNGSGWSVYVATEGLEVENENITLEVGQTARAGITRVPSNATSGTITYESSNTEVATVTTSGVIVGVAAGTCDITGTWTDPDDPNHTYEAVVHVTVTGGGSTSSSEPNPPTSSEPGTSEPTEPTDGGGLGTGAIIGIVIGVIAAVVVVGLVVFFVVRKKKKAN